MRNLFLIILVYFTTPLSTLAKKKSKIRQIQPMSNNVPENLVSALRGPLRIVNVIKNQVIDHYCTTKNFKMLNIWLADRRIVINNIPRLLLFKMREDNLDKISVNISRDLLVELQNLLKSQRIDVLKIIFERIKPSDMTSLDTFMPNMIANSISMSTLIMDYIVNLLKQIIHLIPESYVNTITTTLIEIMDEQRLDVVLNFSMDSVAQLRDAFSYRKTIKQIVNHFQILAEYIRQTKFHSNEFINFIIGNGSLTGSKELNKSLKDLNQLLNNSCIQKIIKQITIPMIMWARKKIKSIVLKYISDNLENNFNQKIITFGLYLLPNNLGRLLPYIQNSIKLFDIYSKLLPQISFITGTYAFQIFANMIGKQSLGKINTTIHEIDQNFSTIITPSIEILTSDNSPLKYIREDDIVNLKKLISTKNDLLQLYKSVDTKINSLI